MTRIKLHLKKLLYILPMIALAALIYAEVVETRNIAVNHDELWDYYPAVGMMNAQSLVPWQEVSLFGFPFPLVTGPYQGALKTWLVAPVLKVLGTSPYVLRGINVFFGLFYLWCLYWALSAAIPRKFSLTVFLVPLMDPNFLVYTPMDYGPFLMQAIFSILAIGCLGRYMLTSRQAYLSYGFLFAGMTLAQKLTSMPLVITYLAAVAVFARNFFLDVVKQRKILVPATLLVLLVVPLIPHLVYFAMHGLDEFMASTRPDRSLPYFEKLKADLVFFINSLNGVEWTRRLTGKELTPAPLPVLGYAGIILIVLSSIVSLRKDCEGTERKIGLMYLFLLVFGFLTFSFFKGLDRPWHYHVLHPLFILAVFHSMFVIWNYAHQRHSKALVYGVSCVLALVMLVPGAAAGWRLLELQEREKGFVISSLGLYALEKELEARGAINVICLNYSLGNPLYVLSGGRMKTYDLTWMEKKDALLYAILRDTYATPNTYIVYRHSYYKEWEQDWISWINQGSTFMFERLPTLDIPVPVRSVRFSDSRDTEFGLIFF